MASMAALLSRLKYESKKNVTKVSRAKDREIEYRVESIELFGETYIMKAVHVKNNLGYKVGWILDSQTKACMRCDGGFGMIKWRHHCRSCGYVVCGSCGNKKVKVVALEADSCSGSRACKYCYNTQAGEGSSSKDKEDKACIADGAQVKTLFMDESKIEEDAESLLTSVDYSALLESDHEVDDSFAKRHRDTLAALAAAHTSTHPNTSACSSSAPARRFSAAAATALHTAPSGQPSVSVLVGPSGHSAHAQSGTGAPRPSSSAQYAPKMRGSGSLGPAPERAQQPPQPTQQYQPSYPTSLCTAPAASAPRQTRERPSLGLGLPNSLPPPAAAPGILVDCSNSHTAATISQGVGADAAPRRKSFSSKMVLVEATHPTDAPVDPQSRSEGNKKPSQKGMGSKGAYEEGNPHSSHRSRDSTSSLDSSTFSIDTRTAHNTALNAALTAPPPALATTSTAPYVYPSNAVASPSYPSEINPSTPPSTGSIGSGEAPIDAAKFGSPMTRRLIMDDARSNVIWEALDTDGDTSTNCSPNTRTHSFSSTGKGVDVNSPLYQAPSLSERVTSGGKSSRSATKARFVTDPPTFEENTSPNVTARGGRKGKDKLSAREHHQQQQQAVQQQTMQQQVLQHQFMQQQLQQQQVQITQSQAYQSDVPSTPMPLPVVQIPQSIDLGLPALRKSKGMGGKRYLY
ncbi:hypothetical protein B484DRAFT_445298 [Ochromonadaceae sp. CCMP2298]|nr:hypothetical protein B484DRAFT_445298 [Ochromonadaceae sp. CCMP2298]